ncbi:hypothetical protein BDP27DRAFT_1234938 [Rhodocollybia butyracea]|uniref:DUF6536 domain-containing protein n=1 Tax=Rhodocollybia butyracea TaxID=206335 RepID=A0A9P5PE36_9AGAR|nr:hypothetical protein BDP27DRAFT_1234938 [Rhodocollybia butyracea]
MAALEAGVVLLINLIILLFCAVKTGGSIGVTQIFEGDCNTVDRVTLGIHLVINVLGTLLLSASNYVMQSLSAPTRAEVDRAHEKGLWLDIGLQSMHNLKYTGGWKRLLWILLSVSSIPLHLFYNSSFFSTISANDYNWYLAQGPEMQDLPKNNWTFNWECPDIEPFNWELLNPSDCLQTYAMDFLSDRRDLVVVLGDYTSNNTFVNQLNSSMFPVASRGLSPGLTPFDWICDFTSGIPRQEGVTSCSTEWREIDPSSWIMAVGLTFSESEVQFLKVQYCLSETTASRCQLQFNLPLLIIVVAFNLVKVICMVIVVTRTRDNPLVTLGDAIASFTQNPEPLTKDMSLVSRGLDKNEDTTSLSIMYQPRKTRWMTTASRRHWIVMGFLVYGLRGFSSLWQLGIGKASSGNIIIGWAIPTHGYGATVASVLLANLPQLIFSMIYLVFNSLCTKLFLALEWSSYAHSRKPLRVSDPHGDQRSTYFLNIPIRFGVPLIVYSALLHWLLSQSIFVVAVTFWNGDVLDKSNSITSCGYSPVAMILTIIIGASLVLSCLAVGCFKCLQCDMPLAGSCSKAIAAACHPPEDGSDPLKPMKWGVVPKIPDSSNPAIGHISFSSAEVSAPVPGCYYL